jgi:hypothetical protein
MQIRRRAAGVFDRHCLGADVDDLRPGIDVRYADLIVDGLEGEDRFLFTHRSGSNPNEARKPGKPIFRRDDRHVGFSADEIREV